MKKLLASLVASLVATGLAAGGPGNAGAKGGGGHAPTQQAGKPAPHAGHAPAQHGSGGQADSGGQPNRVGSNYHQTHGKSFSGGYCYPGPSHGHWTYSGYSWKYGCTCYWCPSTCCYYYWCQPACCYYPITYTYCPPVPVAQGPVQTQTQIQGPPAGVPPLPR